MKDLLSKEHYCCKFHTLSVKSSAYPPFYIDYTPFLQENLHRPITVSGEVSLYEHSLKVQQKSLKTALDEVHFIVNLYSFYSFPLPLVPQAKPSFPRVNHLRRSQAKQLPKLPPLPLGISTIAIVCSFSSSLSHSQQIRRIQ